MIPAEQFLKLCSTEFLSELVGERVIKVSVSTGGSQTGENIAGNLLSIHVKTIKSKIFHIIIKVPPFDSISQFTYVRRRRIFELESRFYNSFLPDLQTFLRNFLQARNIQNIEAKLQLPIPKCYSSSRDYVALEDLRPEGYKLADKFAGLDWSHTKVVMETLARYHAMTYLFIKDRGAEYFALEENYCYLNQLVLPQFNPEFHQMNNIKFGKFYSQACEILGETNPSLSKKISKLIPQAAELMRGYRNKTGSSEAYFPVLSHGDLWVNNMIFKEGVSNGLQEGETASRTLDLVFLDFQQVRRESIFYDLSYFLFTSTTPEFRAEYLNGALETYYASFLEYLKSVGVLEEEVPRGFTQEWLKEEFRANLPFIFSYLTFAIPLQLGNWSLIFGHPHDVKTPTEFASEDKLLDEEDYLDELNETAYKLLKNTPVCLKRFEAVAKELDALGVFDKF